MVVSGPRLSRVPVRGVYVCIKGVRLRAMGGCVRIYNSKRAGGHLINRRRVSPCPIPEIVDMHAHNLQSTTTATTQALPSSASRRHGRGRPDLGTCAVSAFSPVDRSEPFAPAMRLATSRGCLFRPTCTHFPVPMAHTQDGVDDGRAHG